ncbi:uncharacterized protein KIAA1671 homolog isoform X2 [Nothoprocta perdicaria]|uniref:uncharacterized protein KIAA1671 homolog isoform X2 n=1 Tax=Nothoprocta perdicaria TaxID=30464 RepID=UPI000E1C25CB|nr:uncharacterized protein KIAA1671 homolog isoform X2 [Nothoprocta perdicaria]
MATKVEISSALASLTAVPDLKEITKEDKPQRVYVSVLSDASNKAHEPSAPRALEEKNKFTSTLRSATMPTLGSRPRLFPKPFSKEKSSDTFANVKPPVTAFKPSNLIRKAAEETSPAKGLSGSVPPLVEHKVIESEHKATSEVVTNMTFYTGPSANTVILFETAGTEQSKVSVAQGKRAADDHRVFGTLQTKELQFNTKLEKPSQPSEATRKTEGSIHRQISLSPNPRPVSWNSLKTREKKDAYEDVTGEKTSDDTNNVSSRGGFSDVQQRLKPRPVSAAFLESLRDQKHQPVESVEEKSPTEKSWARKPRPLSMDLTAKFEHKDLSPCKKTCSSHESKENMSLTYFTDVSCREQSEMGPKNEDKEFKTDSSSKTSLKRSSHDIGVLNDGKYLWESQQKCKSEPSESKPEVAATSRGSERCSDASGDSRANKEAKRSDLKETCVLLTRESPAAPSEKENSIKRGSVKKHISLFASESPSAPVDTEPLPSPGERENGYVTIQQRIKELTTESADVKPAPLRRSPQSRPLSADLTKMFSSPTSSSEVKPEKPAEIRNDSTTEMQEKSKEAKLLQGTDFSEASAVGNAWKPRQILKLTNKVDQAEAKGGFLGDSQHFPLQGENSVSFTSSFEKKLKPAPVMEKTYVKTVRATMFDHNVERHNVAAGHSAADSALKMTNELERKPDTVTLGHNKGSQGAEAVEETASMKQYHRQAHSSKHTAEGERSGNAACSSEGKKMTQTILLEKPAVEKSEKHTPRNVEDSVTHQRIEPRYEVFQTFGERVLSEAITMAPEKKAMTLRTRKSSVKEKKNNGDVLHTEQPARLNNKTDYLKEAGDASETKDTKMFPSRFTFKEPNDFSFSACTLPEQKKDPGKPETAPILIAEKIHYSTDKNKSLGINEQANKPHSEVKNEESEVPSTERPSVVKYSSEKRSVRSGRAEGHEFRTNFGHEVILTSVNKHGAQSSSVVSSGQVCKSSSSHHPDMEVLSTSKEKPRAFDLRKCVDSVEQSFSLDRTAHESREKFRVTEPEEKIRRTKSSIADLKISERWRRKTLPQDSSRMEEVGLLTPESIRRLNRTESLQLEEGLVKKRTKKSREGMEGDEPNQTAEDYLKNQSSAFEPKETYFAVTYQVPGDKKEKSFGTPSAREACKISPSGEVVASNLDPAFSQRSKPVLQQPNKNITHANCREDSRDAYISKDWVKEEEKNEANSSRSIAVTNFQLSGKDNQKYHEKNLDCAKDKTVDVNAFLLKQDLENTRQTDLRGSARKVSSYYEPRFAQHFTQLHKSSELVSHKSTESNFDTGGGKAEHGYRSRILDIDALMAEYKEESVTQEKLPEDHSVFNRELPKNKRHVSDLTSSSYSWKERKGSEHCFAKNKQGDHAQDYNRPEKLILNEKNSEKVETFGSEFDKHKPKERKFSPPYWGSPSSLFSEKLVNSPVEFTRKKTFIIDEDQEMNLVSRQQSSAFAVDRVQPASVIGTDQKLEINLASKLVVKADVGPLQKKLLTKEQFLEVASEGDQSRDVTRSYMSKSKDDAGKTWRDGDPASVKSRTDWQSYTCSLGSAAPDLRRSYSEKSRQGKDTVPLTKEARGRKDLHRFRQSFPPESVETGWQKKTSSQSESFFHEDRKASGKVWTRQSSEKADGADFTLHIQRRSQSFYKDRRVDSWTDQLKQCFSRPSPEAKDTDTLVREPDSRFAAESPSSENNVISSRKQPPNSHPSSLSSQTEPASQVDHHDSSRDQRSTSLDRSSTDIDSTDGADLPPPGDTYPEEKTTDFSFIDQTTVLDSSALKTRAQLSKKRRHRAPLSHSLRRSRGLEFENRFSLEDPDTSWMFKDSTEEKKTMQQEDSDEEEKIHRIGKSSSVQAQRLPVFPGMDHAVLKAQLRKRQESETSGEVSSAQLFKSPKAPGSRVPPSSAEREDRSEEKSPQWLKELKSKKRQSHYENQV